MTLDRWYPSMKTCAELPLSLTGLTLSVVGKVTKLAAVYFAVLVTFVSTLPYVCLGTAVSTCLYPISQLRVDVSTQMYVAARMSMCVAFWILCVQEKSFIRVLWVTTCLYWSCQWVENVGEFLLHHFPPPQWVDQTLTHLITPYSQMLEQWAMYDIQFIAGTIL